MSDYVELSYIQVGLTALLILVNGAISIGLRLGMERSLFVASLRTVVQLLLVGLVLDWVFRLDRWYVVLGVACLMTLIAGLTAAGRNQRRYPGIWLNTVISVWASAWIVTGFALFAVMQGIDKWYQPQYAIPLLGMVLGNTLNGISVGLNTLTESLVNHRDRVEALLALGANVSLEQDAADNWKPSKKKSIERIDGIVALIMGLDRATTQPPPYQWSGPEVVAP